METTSATALLCLKKPNCVLITMKGDSPLAVTKVVADGPATLEPMEYKIEGDDPELRKRMISHIVDNYAFIGADKMWEVVDLDS